MMMMPSTRPTIVAVLILLGAWSEARAQGFEPNGTHKNLIGGYEARSAAQVELCGDIIDLVNGVFDCFGIEQWSQRFGINTDCLRHRQRPVAVHLSALR